MLTRVFQKILTHKYKYTIVLLKHPVFDIRTPFNAKLKKEIADRFSNESLSLKSKFQIKPHTLLKEKLEIIFTNFIASYLKCQCI